MRKSNLYIGIDSDGPIPIYMQVIIQIKGYIANGLLVPGEKLPSVRKLSRQLGVNPNTVARAYQELEREGIIRTTRGIGAFVGKKIPRISQQQRSQLLNRILDYLFTEAYHLQYSKEELRSILMQRLENWNPCTTTEDNEDADS
jgi:GntR family transcriptional regulator